MSEPDENALPDTDTDTLLVRPESKQKSIRSYVIRAGRMTVGQKSAFDRYWRVYGLSLHDGLLGDGVQDDGLLGKQKAFERDAPLVVEVGFGMGDSLLEMVQAEPDKNFIGIEVHPPGVGRLINSAGKAGINNLKVYMADAIDVLTDCFADNSIDRFQLYFPDPWHKKKHNKRRIVQKTFVELIAKKLKVGGVFHLATDWENYAEHMLEVFAEIPQLKNQAGENNFSPRPDFRPITKFEQRGERLGHGVWDLLYVK